jgi:hypothetical protein
MIGSHRVDPVPQAGAEADQADPVPQQRAELADRLRGDPAPPGAGPRAAAAPGWPRRPLSFFTPLRGDRLAPQRVHQVRLEAVVLQQADQPAQPNAASNATGVPGGRSPISRSIGSEPFTTFLFSCTWPSPATTATWERLRCTSMPT